MCTYKRQIYSQNYTRVVTYNCGAFLRLAPVFYSILHRLKSKFTETNLAKFCIRLKYRILYNILFRISQNISIYIKFKNHKNLNFHRLQFNFNSSSIINMSIYSRSCLTIKWIKRPSFYNPHSHPRGCKADWHELGLTQAAAAADGNAFPQR